MWLVRHLENRPPGSWGVAVDGERGNSRHSTGMPSEVGRLWRVGQESVFREICDILG